MDKKLPKVFANKIDKKINNNETYYATNENRGVKEEITEKESYNINQKIRNIFNSTRYVYKADVVITMTDKTVTKKIIGKNNNQLITIDNELIPISDILDIKFKDWLFIKKDFIVFFYMHSTKVSFKHLRAQTQLKFIVKKEFVAT